jgi:peroxiredoxin Q/BCP
VLKDGDAAPDFVLKDADGQDLRLSTLLGRPVVLYFYPKDRTTGCTIEAKSFRDEHAELARHGAHVLGVSLDGVDSHCEVRDRLDLPFTLLSDPDGRVHDLYDAWWTTVFGKTAMAVRRCTFVIDADGIVRRVHKRVNPIGHAKQVLRDLDSLAVAERPPAP